MRRQLLPTLDTACFADTKMDPVQDAAKHISQYDRLSENIFMKWQKTLDDWKALERNHSILTTAAPVLTP